MLGKLKSICEKEKNIFNRQSLGFFRKLQMQREKEARTSPNILIIDCRKPNDIQYVNFCFHSRFKQCQKRKTKPPPKLVE